MRNALEGKSAIIATLNPGAYRAVVRGANIQRAVREGIHAGFTINGYTLPLELPPDAQGNPGPRNYPVPYPAQYRPVGE